MDIEEFYQLFCSKMRVQGKVTLKHMVNSAGIPEREAKKHMTKLKKDNRVKVVGRGRSTAYTFQ